MIAALLLTAVLAQTPADDCRAAKDNANSAIGAADADKTLAANARSDYLFARGDKPRVPNDGADSAQSDWGSADQFLQSAERRFQDGLGQESFAAIMSLVNQAVGFGYYAMASESFFHSQRDAYGACNLFRSARSKYIQAKGWY